MERRRSVLVLGLSIAAVLGVTTVARAGDHARLKLTRDAASASCPDERALGDAVAARLGYEPFVVDAPQLVVVTFNDDGAVLRGTVQMKDAQGRTRGQRSFTSARRDCDELASTAALTISILLDPRSGLVPPRPPDKELTPDTPPTAPPPPLPAASLDPEDPARTPVAPPSEPVRLRVTAAGGVAFGTAPAPAVVLLVGVGIERRRWTFGGEFRSDLPSSETNGGLPPRTSYVAGSAVACGRFSLAYACGVVTLGALRGEVLGAAPSRQSTFHALLGPRVGLTVPLASFLAFDAHADGAYALTSTSLRVGPADVWTTSTLAALVTIGAVGLFP